MTSHRKSNLGSIVSCSRPTGIVTCPTKGTALFMHMRSTDKHVNIPISGSMSYGFENILVLNVHLTVSGPYGFGTDALQGPLGIFSTQKLCLFQ